ncbi:potassium channel family protein [Actinomycetospora straminea]|uniref:potassium channel family protein n=1 Tax=Actinomycetospora straminea TaxID=663607 RepID=UPI0023651907|nr:potassium channel family protein [Actinomycetospora straminea]MDD7935612.1 ion channel [Actinomycetospora straminea]
MTGPATAPAASPSAREVALSVARSVLAVVLLVLVYLALPLQTADGDGAWLLFVVGLPALVAVVVWQLRAIVEARHPALRALEAFAVAIPLYLLLFAAVYVLLSAASPATFTTPLTRVDALYFTMTVFATVGFGDITPLSQTGRVLVTLQMVGNLLVLGLLVRSFLEAVRRGQRRRQEP